MGLKFFYSALIGLFIYLLAGLFSTLSASPTYPIAELGNCRDAKECYLYCEIPKNQPACWSYGKYVLRQGVLGENTTSEEEMAKKYNISFPISELGNCTSIAQCRSYCENQANHDTCISFAKKKGFYKEVAISSAERENKQALLEKAKTEIGCTSFESCRSFCEQNPVKCSEFSQKHGMQNRSESQASETKKEELIQKARTELGCTSMETCRNYCEKHKEQCLEFGKKHNPSEPSTSTQMELKKRYCEEHPSECRGYSESTQDKNTESQSSGSYLGPSGCKTESECKSYCQSHLKECPGFQTARPTYAPYPTYTPQSYPTYYPQPTYSQQPPTSVPQQTTTSTPQQQPSSSEDQAAMCAKYGCTWNGTACNCSSR